MALKCSISILVATLITALAFEIELDILKVESPTIETGSVKCHLRATRFNRTLYVITGNMTTKEPFASQPSKFFIRTNIYFSSKPNNQYTLTPFRLPERSFCEFLNTDYKKYILNSAKGHSTLPASDDASEDLCAKFINDAQHFYEIYDASIDKRVFPMTVGTGYYKFEILLSNGMLPDKPLDTQILLFAHIYR